MPNKEYLSCRKLGILWNSTLVCRKTSFHPLLWTSSGLKGTWKLSAYIGLVSLRCAKTVKKLVQIKPKK